MLGEMGKSVLITGANGFLGRNLSSHLVHEGYRVSGIVRKNADIDPHTPVRYFVGDLLCKEFLNNVILNVQPEIIFHFAALSRVGMSFALPGPVLETNIMSTIHLLEAARFHAPGCRIIFASSAEVYGHSISSYSEKAQDNLEIPFFLESQPTHPSTSPYSISKMCGEHLMECYHRSYGLDVIVVRSFNIEGVGRGDDFATATICRQAAILRQDPGIGYTIGNLAVFRDFTHISDALRAYTLVATNGVSGEVYNLGSMNLTSLASFLLYATESAGFIVHEIHFPCGVTISEPLLDIFYGKSIIKLLDFHLLEKMDLVKPHPMNITLITDKGIIPIRIDPARFRPFENAVLIADNTKMHRFGYAPAFSVQQIACEQVSHYLKQGMDN